MARTSDSHPLLNAFPSGKTQAPTGLAGLMGENQSVSPSSAGIPSVFPKKSLSGMQWAACLAVGIFMGCAGLLFCVSLSFASGALSKNASDALSMGSVQEESSPIFADTPKPVLDNLHKLQKENPIRLWKAPPPEPEASITTMLAQASSTPAFTVESIKRDLHDPIGRPNPFDPLVKLDEDGSNAEPEKRDLLLDLQYTGFIGDTRSKDKVAIIHLNDPMAGEKTLIKKAGESFIVEGERAVISAIAQNGLRLNLSGKSRWLDLQPYTEMAPVSSGASGASSPVLPNASPIISNGASVGMKTSAHPNISQSSSRDDGSFLKE